MPNKRPPRNAYVFFVMEMMPELRRRGLPVKGLRDAVPHCSEEWAVQGKAALVPTLTEKAVVQLDASSKRNQGSAESVFYFLHILSHGELPSHCDQRFLPCEIACVRYSLHDGLMGSFHHFIDPGEIPRGFRFQCQAASTATHQIPISGFELTNSDYHNLFRELCGFVCPAPGTWPPVYCKSDDLYRIKWCLKWLADKAGMENKFKLLNVEDLIVKLYKDKLREEPSRTRVCSLFEVSEWDYARNTRCKWHEEKDILFCSLASCKKITYCISRALAPVYGINLTPAHLPTREKDVQNSGNPKIVVLDAKRFQNRMDSRYFYDNPLNSGAADVNGNHALVPRGLTPYKPSLGRGRGIVRLLESLSFAEK
ncbi:protein maelstrom homolog isoform X2 [Ascaphus truei]|uniref:protein maelstrom homolog isoform X2 n=1 Tax=Ascaphus truei TaxID=8439 RepID=UPI003F5A57A7